MNTQSEARQLMNNLRLFEIELKRQISTNALVDLNPLLAEHLERVLIELKAAMLYLDAAADDGQLSLFDDAAE